MPEIKFVKNFKPFTVEKGDLLMPALLNQGMPVASSCHGQAVCGKCRVEIVSGKDNLSEETPLEKEVRRRNKIPEGHRISCQTRVQGDITIDTTYW